jgi:hypothetical protein
VPEAEEMTGGWKVEENQKTGFPPLSTGLGNRYRDSHISTAPNPTLLMERRIQNQRPYHTFFRLILQ